MKRQIVYPGAIPFDTDLLNAQKNSLEGLGKLAHAILGDGPFVNNLQCTPTAPASMAVQIAPGQIYQLLAIDSGIYGALAADSHTILKQGLLRDAVTLNCPAPTTSGQSINYLVQAQYVDQDINPAVLPYYNSANPAQSLNGPSNSGQAQNTARDGACVVTVKAGASAPSGSQVTPAVDSGCIGLYVITVAYGATTVTAANITPVAGAPFISEKLATKISQVFADVRYLQISSFQNGGPTYALDTGTANTCQAAYTPAITALTDGMKLRFKAKTANTGASTFAPNGMVASPIYGAAHSALQGGEIQPNSDIELIWNSSLNSGNGAWVILESTGGAAQVGNATQTQQAVARGQVLNLQPIFNRTTLAALGANGSWQISSTITAPCKGVVIGLGIVNVASQTAAGINATLTIGGTQVSNDSVNLSQVHTGSAVVNSGSSTTVQLMISSGATAPNQSCSISTLAVFIPTP